MEPSPRAFVVGAALLIGCSDIPEDSRSEPEAVVFSADELERLDRSIPHYADAVMVIESGGSREFAGQVGLSVSDRRVFGWISGTELRGTGELQGTFEVPSSALDRLAASGVDVVLDEDVLLPGASLSLPHDGDDPVTINIERITLRSQPNGMFTGAAECVDGTVLSLRGRLVGGCELLDPDGVTPRRVLDLSRVPACAAILGSF